MTPRDDAALAALILSLHAEARAAAPGVAIDEATFGALLRERAGDPVDEAALRRLNVRDLHLAWACARGDAAALALFDESVLARLDPALVRVGAGAILDDVKQAVREKLFVGAADRGPRIVDYAGEGELRTWVRVVALRTAATILRGARRTRTREDALADAPGAIDSPELLHLRQRYAPEFKVAFELAVAELTPRDRELLRQHLLDGQTIDDLGALHGVNRVTASRWLSRAREDVARATRKTLAARLRLSAGEMESVLRLVRSELDLSLERVLLRA
jgi:RNA polymerase sigma-70 factor (ECF subfamily)